jgi:hypothetical protein
MTRFVVALGAEARPLIDRYRLEPAGGGTFRVYQGGGRRLVVSGVGKVAAAAATAYLHEEPSAVWLNVGIAGHRDRTPGELLRANRVTDAATGERFYPTLLGLTAIDSAGVTTVDAPETELASPELFDMEASGFYATALRFSTSELVQCVKIVSDNLATGIDGVTSARVSELVERKLDAIDAVVSHLESIATDIAPERGELEVTPFTDTWHFTTSQTRRLRRLLVRCRAFRAPVRADDFKRLSSAAAVLDGLDEHVKRLATEQREF